MAAAPGIDFAVDLPPGSWELIDVLHILGKPDLDGDVPAWAEAGSDRLGI